MSRPLRATVCGAARACRQPDHKSGESARVERTCRLTAPAILFGPDGAPRTLSSASEALSGATLTHTTSSSESGGCAVGAFRGPWIAGVDRFHLNGEPVATLFRGSVCYAVKAKKNAPSRQINQRRSRRPISRPHLTKRRRKRRLTHHSAFDLCNPPSPCLSINALQARKERRKRVTDSHPCQSGYSHFKGSSSPCPATPPA